MNRTLTLQRQLFIFGLPILFIAVLIFVVKSPIFDLNKERMSFAITMDLLIIIPLIYFLLIRKTTISKTTIVPLLIFGLVIGTYILPEENQQFLNFFKLWIFPFIELLILSYVLYKVRKGVLNFKKHQKGTIDFFTHLKEICYEILPKKVVIAFATEIVVFYYGFIYWKKRIPKQNEFTYHKNSGTISLLVAIIFIVGIETYVLHILLIKWNNTIALIFGVLSIYSGIQIFGFLKSLLKRPYIIEHDKLKLYYGILSETIIDLNEIESIEISSEEIEFNKENRKLSPLGTLESHNMIVNLKNENVLIGLYGINRKYKKIAFYVDDKVKFKNAVEIAIINSNSLF